MANVTNETIQIINQIIADIKAEQEISRTKKDSGTFGEIYRTGLEEAINIIQRNLEDGVCAAGTRYVNEKCITCKDCGKDLDGKKRCKNPNSWCYSGQTVILDSNDACELYKPSFEKDFKKPELTSKIKGVQ